MSKKIELNTITLTVVLIIAVSLIAFGIMNVISLFTPSLKERALLGESFNIVSTIFSGLALFAISTSLYIQNNSNKIQRENLTILKEDLKKTSEIQQKQIKLITKQSILNAKTALYNIRISSFDGFSNNIDGYAKKKRLKYIEIHDDAKKELKELIDEINKIENEQNRNSK